MKIALRRNVLITATSVAVLLSLAFVASDHTNNTLEQPAMKFHRSAKIMEGQLPGALLFAKLISEYVNKNYPGYNVQVYLDEADTLGTVYWFADFESREKYNELDQKLSVDSDFNAIILTADAVFEEPVDLFLRSIY